MIEFLKEMTVGNVWLWFHILAGGILAKSLKLFIIWKILKSYPNWKDYATRVGRKGGVLWTLMVAVSWEIFELYYWGYTNYSGGAMGWLADSLGDVLGTLLMALVVVI